MITGRRRAFFIVILDPIRRVLFEKDKLFVIAGGGVSDFFLYLFLVVCFQDEIKSERKRKRKS
jgi:hypothetical protein